MPFKPRAVSSPNLGRAASYSRRKKRPPLRRVVQRFGSIVAIPVLAATSPIWPDIIFGKDRVCPCRRHASRHQIRRSSLPCVFLDEGGAFLRDHHSWRGGVARRDRRHDRRVDDAKPFQTEHTQPFVDDGERVARATHLCGADRMEDRRADIARGLDQAGVIVADGFARQIFGGLIRLQCGLREDATGQPDPVAATARSSSVER